METRTLLLATSFVVLLAGCGKEVGRVPFTAAGKASATFPLTAGNVDFWTDIAIEYEGEASLQYLIALEQGGAKIGTAICNPLGHISVKTTWIQNDINASHARRGSGKMACSTKLAAGGPTTVQVTLALGGKPTSLVLTKADLVVKQ